MFYRIIVFIFLAISLTACRSQTVSPVNNEAADAAYCEMLKQSVSQSNYVNYDPTTMLRKTAAEEARQLQEYNHYGCPAINEQLERQ